MTIPLGVELEKLNALQDAKDIIDERGNDIFVQVVNESGITRDDYGSIKCRTASEVLQMHAFPINYNPTDEALESAGIREKVDLIVTTATLDWMNAGYDYDDIDTTRWELILNGETFLIPHKNRLNMFSHSYLNYTLGLFKK